MHLTQITIFMWTDFQVGVHTAGVSLFSGPDYHTNTDFQVGVHIADVSHFIRPNTALDREAASRGTTVYLSDQVRGSCHGEDDDVVMMMTVRMLLLLMVIGNNFSSVQFTLWTDWVVELSLIHI